jgi:hypothetical protein
MKKNLWAIAVATNHFAGQDALVSEFAEYFRAQGGEHFEYALDDALTVWPDHLEVIYERQAGWYTLVYIRCKKPIDFNEDALRRR